MENNIKDKLIEMQQNGHAITVRFAGIGIPVFKVDSGLENALWTLDMRLDEESNNYFLIDINDAFSVEPLDTYKLSDGFYVDLNKQLY